MSVTEKNIEFDPYEVTWGQNTHKKLNKDSL